MVSLEIVNHGRTMSNAGLSHNPANLDPKSEHTQDANAPEAS